MNIEKIIDEVYEKHLKECSIPLSKKQVCNIAKNLLTYEIQSENMFKMALEYSTLIRAEIIIYTNRINPPYESRFKYYNRINYAIDRALHAMGIVEEEVDEAFSDSLESNIQSYEFEIRQKRLLNN